MKKGIFKAKEAIKEFLEEIVLDCNTKDQFFRVAMVSSNYDPKISEIVSEAVFEVGRNGAIEVEPGFHPLSSLTI